MNDQWKQFLESRSARIDDSGVRFPTAAAAPACALTDLSHLGLIRVSGEEADGFLQGQLTNDIREVTGGHWQLSGYCTPKGRLLASFLVFRRDGDLYLQTTAGLVAALIDRLRMFVLLSKVTIEDASDRLVRIGLAGDCAPELLAGRFRQPPGASGGAVTENGITLLRLGGELPRYELIGDARTVAGVWQQLAEKAEPANADYWSLLEIRAGVPSVQQETVEAFVPQMVNMELIDGISFTKGCYTGQEVVARMRYLGKLKRRMYLAHVDTDTCPRPGDAIHSPHSASGQGAGRVVDARPAPEGGCDLLVVLEIASREAGDLRLGDADGAELRFPEQPYPLEQEQTSP